MKGSLERVRRVMSLQKPDRPPLFDLIPNDAVLQHFNDGRPVEIGDDRSGVRALAAALDGSRVAAFSPSEERLERNEDGGESRILRWTAWNERGKYGSSEEYRREKERQLAGWRDEADRPYDTAADRGYQREREVKSWFGDDFYYLLACPSPNLMGIWTEVGLEPFSYYLYDCEEVIVEQLERNTVRAVRWIEGLPADDPFDCVFIGEDIAFKNGPMMRVAWLEERYFPRLKRVIDALHARGLKMMFHSDGNLNAIMDGLVDAGIDALNPIEISAGMDLADLHRRYPNLVFAGGIDVSHLLPFGTTQQIREAVVKAIEDTEGQILVGSSTEVFDIVPLENYLAMREAAMGYEF
jgi:uroporphyrinogen decarboxylase